MKKHVLWFCVIASLMFLPAVVAAESWQDEVKREMAAPVSVDPAPDQVPTLATSGALSLRDEGDEVVVTITDPMLTPKEDTRGQGLYPAAKLKIPSAVMDAKGLNPYFALVEVKDGKTEYRFKNWAKVAKLPVAEHNYPIGFGKNNEPGYLVLNPDDPGVVYSTVDGTYKTKSGEMANLKTLAIGIVMYPDKPSVWMKSLGKGKILQGKRLELAGK
jgi:hypothetical protein